MQAAGFRVAGFGKLPSHGDFVRHNTATPAARAFDEWLQRSLYFLQAQRHADFDAAYDAAPICAFAYDAGRDRTPLVGTMQTSRDGAGRKFPFIVAHELAEPPPDGAARLPVRYDAFLRAAAALTRIITSGEVPHRDVPARLEALDGHAAPDDAPAYDRYLRTTTFGAFGEAVWTYFEDSRKYLLFKNLLEVLLPHRGHGRPRLSYGLRFPLHPDAPSASAAFWMEVCGRLLGGRLEDVSCFWTLPSGDAAPEAARLVLFFTAPPFKVLGEVLHVVDHGDAVIDLQGVGREQAALAALSIPPEYGQLLEDDALTLHDLLAGL